MFGRVIPRPEGSVDLSAHRADVDNGARCPASHSRKQQLGESCRAEQIDLELIARLLQINFFYRAEEPKSCVVDEDIDGVDFRENRLDSSADFLLARQIHAQGLRSELREL